MDSKVPSNEESSREASRYNTRTSSGRPSPHQSPRPSSMNSPPITPAATLSRDAIVDGTTKDVSLQKVDADIDPSAITPQVSSPGSRTSPSTTHADEESRPGSSSHLTTRPTSRSTESTGAPAKSHGAFSIGPVTADSVPASRDTSPSRSSTGQVYSRPFTPAGDANDPYAANKRPPQSRNLDTIDPRFKFDALGSKHRASPSLS